MGRKLTGKRARFVQEFLKDFNGKQAAIRAGYSPRSAAVEASRLLTNADVSAAVELAQQKAAERNEVTVDRIVQEYAKIAFSTITDYLSFKAGKVTLKDSDTISPHALAAVLEVSERPAPDGRTTISFKLHGKLEALRELGRHLGMSNHRLETKLQEAMEELLDRTEKRVSPGTYAELRSAIAAEMGFGEVAPPEPGGRVEAPTKH